MSKNLALSVIVKEAAPQKISLHSNETFRSIRLLGFLFSSFLLLGVTIFILSFRLELYAGLIILLVVPALVIIFTLVRPSDHRIHIDIDQKVMTHETEYRFSLPAISKVDTETYPLSSFTEMKKEKNTYTDSYALILEAPEIKRMRLNFAQGKEPAKKVYRLLGLEKGIIETPISDGLGEEEIDDAELEWDPVAVKVAEMQTQLSSWARGLFILGIVHFFASGVLDFSWGFILILVALGSMIFRHPAMFVVHVFTLGFIGLSNIFSAGLGFWAFFGIYQIYLAYSTYKQFRQYQEVQSRHFKESEPDSTELVPVQRTERFFPWLSLIFSSLGLSTYCVVFFVAIVSAILTNDTAPMPDLLANIFSAQFNLGLLGLAIGTAALLSNFPRKVLSWIGLVMGVIWFILNIVLIITA